MQTTQLLAFSKDMPLNQSFKLRPVAGKDLLKYIFKEL